MQKLTVIAVGGDKEKYFLEAAEEYRKRLSRFAQTELILPKDEPIPDHPSEKEIAGVLKKEGDRIRAALPDGFLKIKFKSKSYCFPMNLDCWQRRSRRKT